MKHKITREKRDGNNLSVAWMGINKACCGRDFMSVLSLLLWMYTMPIWKIRRASVVNIRDIVDYKCLTIKLYIKSRW